MRSIQVDEEVFAEIQKVAVPLIDDANMALRRVFGLPTSRAQPTVNRPGGRQRVERGKLTAHSILRRLMLEVLVEQGGSASRQTVLSEIDKLYAGKWTEADLVRTKTGEWKWENRVSWERQNMTIAGLLDKTAPHGTWRLTDAGSAEARSLGLAA